MALCPLLYVQSVSPPPSLMSFFPSSFPSCDDKGSWHSCLVVGLARAQHEFVGSPCWLWCSPVLLLCSLICSLGTTRELWWSHTVWLTLLARVLTLPQCSREGAAHSWGALQMTWVPATLDQSCRPGLHCSSSAFGLVTSCCPGRHLVHEAVSQLQ